MSIPLQYIPQRIKQYTQQKISRYAKHNIGGMEMNEQEISRILAKENNPELIGKILWKYDQIKELKTSILKIQNTLGVYTSEDIVNKIRYCIKTLEYEIREAL